MLSAARKGEIAISIVKQQLRADGIPNLQPNVLKRKVGNEAKELGVPENELIEFVREMAADVLSQAFGRKVIWGEDLN